MTVFASYEEALTATAEDIRAAQEYAAHMVPRINEARARGEPLTFGQQQFVDDVARYQATVPWQHIRQWHRVRDWLKSFFE